MILGNSKYFFGELLSRTGSFFMGEGGGRGRMWVLFFILFLAACSPSSDIDEVVEDNEAWYMETSAMLGDVDTPAKMTRAHWNDDNKFSWDNSSNEMVVIVKETATGNIVPWGTNNSCSAKVRNITGAEEVVSVASITSNSGILKTDIQKLTVGQSPVYFLSPIIPDVNGSSINADGVITLALPNEFAHDATPSLSDFKRYTYIKGTSTVSEITKARIQAATTRFTGIPAVIRFAVTNDRGERIKVTGISVSIAEDVAGGFPKTMTWNPGNSSEPSLTASALLYKSLQVSMGAVGHELTEAETEGSYSPFYAFMFPASFESATLTLEGKDNSDNTFTYTCSIPSKTFESGMIYTWNLTIEDNFMRLKFNEYEEGIFQW